MSNIVLIWFSFIITVPTWKFILRVKYKNKILLILLSSIKIHAISFAVAGFVLSFTELYFFTSLERYETDFDFIFMIKNQKQKNSLFLFSPFCGISLIHLQYKSFVTLLKTKKFRVYQATKIFSIPFFRNTYMTYAGEVCVYINKQWTRARASTI